MAIILMLVLFGLFLGVEYARRPARISPGTVITGYVWPGYEWTGSFAQDGGEPYDNFLGEGI